MAQNFGSKRIVVGAHYGLRDWLSQRVTAALMALFTLAVIVQVLLPGEMGYDKWAGIFSRQWMKVLTFVVIVSPGSNTCTMTASVKSAISAAVTRCESQSRRP